MGLDRLTLPMIEMSEKKVQCLNCKHIRALTDTDWSDPMWALTYECTHPDYGGAKMSDIQKIQPRVCEKFESRE